MALRTDSFDLGGLHLTAGEGRRLDLHVAIDPFDLAGERYPVTPSPLPVRVDVSRLTGGGYALRLRFEATLTGPCMRCLEAAALTVAVDAREVSQQQHDSRGAETGQAGRRPGATRKVDDDFESPYVDRGVLDLRAWAREALALALPAQPLCRSDCAGLCPVCGIDLNTAEPGHRHQPEPDPRWAKLSEVRFE